MHGTGAAASENLLLISRKYCVLRYEPSRVLQHDKHTEPCSQVQMLAIPLTHIGYCNYYRIVYQILLNELIKPYDRRFYLYIPVNYQFSSSY